jgi:hypothetical protein
VRGGHNPGFLVQDALAIVIVAVVVVSGLVGVGLLLAGRGAHDHIGRGGIEPRQEGPGADGYGTLEAEVRAVVEARNARRIARGEAPLDVEAEVEQRLFRADG